MIGRTLCFLCSGEVDHKVAGITEGEGREMMGVMGVAKATTIAAAAA